MKVKDLPGFPPIWTSSSLQQFSGMLGTLKHVRVDDEERTLIIVIEEREEYFIGYYQAEAGTLRRLVAVLETNAGKPLETVAEMEI